MPYSWPEAATVPKQQPLPLHPLRPHLRFLPRSPCPAGEAGQRLPETLARLGLDEAQATKFKEISQRYAKQGRELRQNAGGDRQAARAAGRKKREKIDAEVNAILNEEQQAIYAKIKAEQLEEMRSRRQGGGGGRPGGGRPGGGA